VVYIDNARAVQAIPKIQAAGLVVPLDEALGRQVAAAGDRLTVVSLGSAHVTRRFEGAQALLSSYSTCYLLAVGWLINSCTPCCGALLSTKHLALLVVSNL
jgi:hypothetical protein